MSSPALLDNLQCLLARIVDVPVHLPVTDFLFSEREHCTALLGRELGPGEEEQVLLREHEAETELSVYIDGQVLRRLDHDDPVQCLSVSNLADFCVALEGVSHFQYLVWCVKHQRQASLLELELQADVDKYAVAVYLLARQSDRSLVKGLRRRLFDNVSFVRGMSLEIRERYVEANRSASRFCQQLEQRFLSRQHYRPEAWLRALQSFYRYPHRQKLRRALS